MRGKVSEVDPCAEPDNDGDGFLVLECGGDDCDDADPFVFVGAEDGYGDDLDQNCDGVDGLDADADGWASNADGGPDCDDTNPELHPDARDLLGDMVDNNCDGIDGVDADADGWPSEDSSGLDRDDTNADINPEAGDGGDFANQSVVDGYRIASTAIGFDDAGFVHLISGETYNKGGLGALSNVVFDGCFGGVGDGVCGQRRGRVVSHRCRVCVGWRRSCCLQRR